MARATLTISARLGNGQSYELAELDIENLRSNVRPVVAQMLRELAIAVEESEDQA